MKKVEIKIVAFEPNIFPSNKSLGEILVMRIESQVFSLNSSAKLLTAVKVPIMREYRKPNVQNQKKIFSPIT
jgi:hypothetical protein